jgi:hypothetical protein
MAGLKDALGRPLKYSFSSSLAKAALVAMPEQPEKLWLFRNGH